MDAKQRKQKQYKQARELGLNSAQAKKYYNYSEKTFQQKFKEEKTRIKKNTYNAKRREKYQEARKQGLTSDEAKYLRSHKKADLENARSHIPDREYMVVGYREFTHGDDPQVYYMMKQANRSASAETLVEAIKEEFLQPQGKGGFIGDYRIDIVLGEDELHRLKMLYRETNYIPMYVGEGKSLPPILSCIAVALGIMYHDMAKFLILEIIENLRMLHSEKAHKNADYLEKHLVPILRGGVFI